MPINGECIESVILSSYTTEYYAGIKKEWQPGSGSAGLEAATTPRQCAHWVPRSWFLNTSLYERESGTFGKRAHSKPGAAGEQDSTS